MIRIRFLVAAMIGMVAWPVDAGVYADDLTKCLVSKASPTDQTVFMQWMFAALSASPAVKDMASTTQAQHEKYNKLGAALFSRLLLTDCRTEVVAAIKYEGGGAIQGSFQTLGQIASRGLMTDQNVQKQMEGLSAYFDESKLKDLGREAGVPDDKPAPPSAPK